MANTRPRLAHLKAMKFNVKYILAAMFACSVWAILIGQLHEPNAVCEVRGEALIYSNSCPVPVTPVMRPSDELPGEYTQADRAIWEGYYIAHVNWVYHLRRSCKDELGNELIQVPTPGLSERMDGVSFKITTAHEQFQHRWASLMGLWRSLREHRHNWGEEHKQKWLEHLQGMQALIEFQEQQHSDRLYDEDDMRKAQESVNKELGIRQDSATDDERGNS